MHVQADLHWSSNIDNQGLVSCSSGGCTFARVPGPLLTDQLQGQVVVLISLMLLLIRHAFIHPVTVVTSNF